MSPILEAQVGDEIVCIAEFSASPHGEGFAWETGRTFRIGERLRYAGYYRDDHFKDHPTGWMVLFDAADGKRYSATQTYFATVDCWRGLKRFFARRLLREPRRSGGDAGCGRPVADFRIAGESEAMRYVIFVLTVAGLMSALACILIRAMRPLPCPSCGHRRLRRINFIRATILVNGTRFGLVGLLCLPVVRCHVEASSRAVAGRRRRGSPRPGETVSRTDGARPWSRDIHDLVLDLVPASPGRLESRRCPGRGWRPAGCAGAGGCRSPPTSAGRGPACRWRRPAAGPSPCAWRRHTARRRGPSPRGRWRRSSALFSQVHSGLDAPGPPW